MCPLLHVLLLKIKIKCVFEDSFISLLIILSLNKNSASVTFEQILEWNKIRRAICTLQEYQTITTNARLSKVSDFGFIMVVYENFFFTILKYLKEIRNCMSKLILPKIFDTRVIQPTLEIFHIK